MQYVFKFKDLFIDYLNFKVAKPIKARIIAIIQNLITIVTQPNPFSNDELVPS